MSAPRRRAGVAEFLIGAAAAIGGARLFAPSVKARSQEIDERTGRGAAGIPPSGDAVTAGHEPVDADARGIFRIMAIYGGAALASVALMAILLHVLHRADNRADAGLTAVQRIQVAPPEPNLQADPAGDIARLRTHEYRMLHTLARIDGATARIPIDLAMALMAGQLLDRADTQGDGRLPVQGAGR